jgi:purine-binding chemotaxis protein CheW
VPLAPEHVAGLINLRGEIMMVVDLRRRLGLPERSQDQKPFHLVMYGNDGCVSLMVDRVGDVVELYEQDFEETPEVIQGLARQLILGVYKSESGMLLSIDTEKATNVLFSMNNLEGSGANVVRTHGKSADDTHDNN